MSYRVTALVLPVFVLLLGGKTKSQQYCPLHTLSTSPVAGWKWNHI